MNQNQRFDDVLNVDIVVIGLADVLTIVGSMPAHVKYLSVGTIQTFIVIWVFVLMSCVFADPLHCSHVLLGGS